MPSDTSTVLKPAFRRAFAANGYQANPYVGPAA